jgi:transglutaminase-like putative cysteine protease
MHTEIIQRAAQEAAGRETNPLRKMYAIRNYVYDRLSYGIKPHIDTPDIALRRGIGSCGEYVGVLLALARLNGIACQPPCQNSAKSTARPSSANRARSQNPNSSLRPRNQVPQRRAVWRSTPPRTAA